MKTVLQIVLFALIAVFASILVFRLVIASRTHANELTAAVTMQIVGRAASSYFQRNGEFPASIQELKTTSDDARDGVFSGSKGGYRYEYSAELDAGGRRTRFFVRGVPTQDENLNGREVCLDNTGVIRMAEPSTRCTNASDAIEGVDQWGRPKLPAHSMW